MIDALGVATFRPDLRAMDTYDDGTVQRGQLPQSAVPERRIRGGLTRLMQALADKAGPVHLGTPVQGLPPANDHVCPCAWTVGI